MFATHDLKFFRDIQVVSVWIEHARIAPGNFGRLEVDQFAGGNTPIRSAPGMLPLPFSPANLARPRTVGIDVGMMPRNSIKSFYLSMAYPRNAVPPLAPFNIHGCAGGRAGACDFPPKRAFTRSRNCWNVT
jgi:hypothetical protein